MARRQEVQKIRGKKGLIQITLLHKNRDAYETENDGIGSAKSSYRSISNY